MQMVYKLFVSILVIGFLQGCNSWTQNSELNKMSNNELEEYFLKYKSELKYLVGICEQYPALKRVEKSKSLYYSKNPSIEVKKTIKRIQSIVAKLKIDNIQCSRSDMVLNNQLLGVFFVLYSSGLGISGEGQLISYDTKRFLDSLPNHKKANISWRTIFPLSEEGWSIIHTN